MISQLQDSVLVLSLNFKYGNMVFGKENLDGINCLTEAIEGFRYLHVLASNHKCKIIQGKENKSRLKFKHLNSSI